MSYSQNNHSGNGHVRGQTFGAYELQLLEEDGWSQEDLAGMEEPEQDERVYFGSREYCDDRYGHLYDITTFSNIRRPEPRVRTKRNKVRIQAVRRDPQRNRYSKTRGCQIETDDKIERQKHVRNARARKTQRCLIDAHLCAETYDTDFAPDYTALRELDHEICARRAMEFEYEVIGASLFRPLTHDEAVDLIIDQLERYGVALIFQL